MKIKDKILEWLFIEEPALTLAILTMIVLLILHLTGVYTGFFAPTANNSSCSCSCCCECESEEI